MDILRIKDLTVFGNHGVFKEEKTLGQKFILDMSLYYDMTRAAKEGNLNASIHYGFLAENIIEEFKSTSYDLIEEACFQLIKFIFREYDLVKKVEIELKKPWAPVHLPIDTISVKMSRKKRNYYLALGTNLGDKKANMDSALEKLIENFTLVKESKEYVTKPWGKEDQGDFLNKVIMVESMEEPLDFLDIIQEIEVSLGRVRIEKWGPRTIDIDILFIDDEIFFDERLKVPHPYIEEREFVLEPMAEIDPFFIHPISRKSITNILNELKKKSNP